MIRTASRALIVLIALVLVAGISRAQSGVELQLGYAHVIPGGDFRKVEQVVDPGNGLEAALAGPWRRWVVAVGLQSTKHEVDYDPLAEDEADLRMVHVYGELRRPFAPIGRIRPYIAARIGLVSMWNTTAFTDDANIRVEGDASQKGPAVGLGAGVNFQVNRWLTLYTAASWVATWLGDIDFDGSKIGGSSSSGSVPNIRVGGTIDFSRPRPQ